MILLTGASGFIGKHLLQSIVCEYGKENVLALTSTPVDQCNYLIHNNYTFKNNYFEDEGYSSKIETIILAGASTPHSSDLANHWSKYNSNIYSVEKILSAFLPNLKKVIYLSTLDVYENSDVISEETLVKPQAMYAEAKLYIEKMLTSWSIYKNVPVQILRIGHVYGPGEELYKKIIPITITKLLQKQPLQIWGDGKEIRSFIYINDVVKAILNAIKLQEVIGTVNIVSNQKTSIKALVEKLMGISKATNTIVHISSSNIPKDFIFDNSKMIKYLLEKETDLNLGLLEEWEYMKSKCL